MLILMASKEHREVIRQALTRAQQDTTIRQIAQEIAVPERALYNLNSMGTLGPKRLGALEDWLTTRGYLDTPAEYEPKRATVAEMQSIYTGGAATLTREQQIEQLFLSLSEDCVAIRRYIRNPLLDPEKRRDFLTRRAKMILETLTDWPQ